MTWLDRIASKPGRIRLTDDDGNSTYYRMEKADEPIQTGTPLNAANMNKLLENSAEGFTSIVTKLETADASPVDDDYYLAQYANGGTTNPGFVRRKTSSLWNYIKAKADELYLGKTATATNSSKVNNLTVETAVPANAKFTDTTYSSKAAASGGTDVSLVTTGEKYTWNSKTSNTGTVTSVAIKMNNTTKGTVTTSGTIDLGTVLTSHQSLSGYVPTSRTVAGHALTGNVTVSASDVGLGNVTNDKQMPIAGGTFTGNAVAYSTNRTTSGLRNTEIRTSSATGTLQSTNKIIMVRK